MANPLSSVRVLDARVAFIEQPFIKPLQISSGAITVITEARAQVRVEVDGCEAEGQGSIYLSDLWAWPDPSRNHEERDQHLRELCLTIARELPALCGPAAHPLELGMHLHHETAHHAVIPPLATAVCMSPFDAAIHDATGQALKRSAFSFYDEDCPVPSADTCFSGGAATRAIRELLASPPRDAVPGWYLISAKDDLSEGLPAWVARGYTQFKVKVLGRSAEEDARRTVEVFQSLQGCGLANPRLSLDSNEGNPDAASVMEYLDLLEAMDKDAYAALAYLEQPTGRDIRVHAHTWHDVARRKPVLLDEGLTDLSLLPLAREQGWSGLALKTCKGHSFALCAAAWAHENGMMLALQDLTNPGLAAIHACLLAAHVPTLNGVELNSPQYTPAANEDWLPRLAGLFQLHDGQHRLPTMSPHGLGTTL